MTSPRKKEETVYEKTYGAKYEETKGLSRVELSKRMRLEIEAAVKSGALPKGNYSVTTQSYAGGGSINITIKSFEVPALFNPEHLALEAADRHYSYPRGERYSLEAKAAMDTLTAIHSAYNYDGSDTQSDYFDVRYYGDVKLDWQYEAARKVEETSALDVSVSARPPMPSRTTSVVDTKPAQHLTLVKPEPEPEPEPVNEQVSFLESIGAL